eukprot:7385763-Prymnesium_polylepis.2
MQQQKACIGSSIFNFAPVMKHFCGIPTGSASSTSNTRGKCESNLETCATVILLAVLSSGT